MSLHPSVDFRALRTKLLSRSRFRDSGHIQALKPLLLIMVARVLFTHQQQFKQQLAPWSGSDLQPSTKLRFTKHQQHGQGKTQYCTHNKKRSAELGRVVVDTQHSFVLNYTGTVESSFVSFVPHAAPTRIRRVSVRFGTTALPRPTFKSAASLPLEAKVHMTWPYESGLELRCCYCHARWLQQDFASFVYLACLDRASALMRPWWCDS